MTQATVNLWCAAALLPEGWTHNVRLSIADGIIDSVKTGTEPEAGDARVECLLPGQANLHSHAFQRAMAGRTEVRGPGADSFWTWREAMYRFVDRITPNDLHAIASMAFVEMLETGFTRVGEFHYLHHDIGGTRFDNPAEMSLALAQAAHDTGIALTLLPVFYAHAGFGGRPPEALQARFVNSPDSFLELRDAAIAGVSTLPDGVVGMAPHSLRAVTPSQLNELISAIPLGPVHIHIAEQQKEVEDCLAWSGARPVEWLLDNCPVDERWCLVHATHMAREETLALARSGAVAGLCPITEANLGDGLFPATEFIEAGGRFGVGSDSNVLIDATEELRLLEYGQRLTLRQRNCFARQPGQSTGEALFSHAGEGGMQALGGVWGIAPGESADLVSLDVAHPSLALLPTEMLCDGLIFAAGRSAIANVWRRGVQQVTGGRHIRRDRIEANYRTVLARLAE